MAPDIHRWPAWRQIVSVASDTQSSASTLGAQGAKAVADLARQMLAVDPEGAIAAVREAADYLVAAQPSVAPLSSFRNQVYLAAQTEIPVYVGLVTKHADQMLASTMALGAVGAGLIDDGSAVMVHSSSSSVRSVLDRAFESVRFKVVCTEALPVGEGRALAAELIAAGFSVELLSDIEAMEWIAGVDLVLAGADAIGPGRVINKVGTADLAEAASAERVPMYIVASLEKVLPEELFDAAVATAVKEGAPGVGGLSEVVPLSWFSGVVTEEGILSPGDLSRRATEQVVHPDLRRL